MKIISVMAYQLIPLFNEANENLNIDLNIYSSRNLNNDSELIKKVMNELPNADLIFLHRTIYSFWDEIVDEIAEIDKKIPLICVGTDTTFFALSTVDSNIVNKAYSYLTYGGYENIEMLLKYFLNIFDNKDFKIAEPIKIPWQAIFHPNADKSFFKDLDEYIDWYKPDFKNHGLEYLHHVLFGYQVI